MPQATEKARNACDQQIAAKGLSTPQDAIAILLHRVVMPLYRVLADYGDRYVISKGLSYSRGLKLTSTPSRNCK